MPPSDPSPTARRVLLGEDARPFAGLDAGRTFDRRGRWPSRWVRGPAGDDADAVPAVVAFRLRVSLDAATTVRAHVSADERYELYLGGRIVGRGPERGDAVAWPFETYDLALPAGASVIVARVWALGELAPFAQMSLHDRGGRYPGPRWLFAPEGPSAGALGTGVAAWEAARLGGRSFVACGPPGFVGPGRSFVGPEERVDAAAYPWGWASGDDGAGDWRPAREGPEALDTRRPLDVAADDVPLSPATLPPQIDRAWPTATARHVEAFGRDGEGDAPPSVVDPARAIPGAADEWDRLLDGSAALHVRRVPSVCSVVARSLGSSRAAPSGTGRSLPPRSTPAYASRSCSAHGGADGWVFASQAGTPLGHRNARHASELRAKMTVARSLRCSSRGRPERAGLRWGS